MSTTDSLQELYDKMFDYYMSDSYRGEYSHLPKEENYFHADVPEEIEKWISSRKLHKDEILDELYDMIAEDTTYYMQFPREVREECLVFGNYPYGEECIELPEHLQIEHDDDDGDGYIEEANHWGQQYMFVDLSYYGVVFYAAVADCLAYLNENYDGEGNRI